MNQGTSSVSQSVEGLTCRQAQVLDAIVDYTQVTQEACSSRYLARRFSVDHTTILDHFRTLHRKGWLRGHSSPAIPTPLALSHRRHAR